MAAPLSNSSNGSDAWPEALNSTAARGAPGVPDVALFCVTGALALAALAGGVGSLAALLPVPRRGALPALVAACSVDDLVGAVAAGLFLRLQWPRDAPGHARPLCAAAALLYTGQGLSGNLKAALLVGYSFVSLRRAAGTPAGCRGRGRALGAALGAGAAGLGLAALPLGGWGAFERTAWGCRVAGPAVPPLCALYAAALALLAGLAGPLAPPLLCSEAPPRAQAQYRAIAGGASVPDSPPPGRRAASDPGSPLASPGPGPPDGPQAGARERQNPWDSRSFERSVAQRRFALILALTKAVLWLPMMAHMLVQHAAGLRSPGLETLGFLLTLLAASVTPLFALSGRWAHLPCGCAVDCGRNPYTSASDGRTAKRRGFEFSLSFQQSYGIYRLARDEDCAQHGPAPPGAGGPGADSRTHRHAAGRASPAGISTGPADSAAREEVSTGPADSAEREEVSTGPTDSAAREEVSTRPADSAAPGGRLADAREPGSRPGPGALPDEAQGDGTPRDGPEKRRSPEESQRPGLSDWEWSRSRSERTPRQRSGGSLATPLCAFQGMVSLQAPTGKTLSLSTYEVSAEGQKITPASKKIEVYRSKSVGHEPNTEDSPSTFADTSVKIHLEVLEICDNDEALDTVSIISNISQSSTQVRSPSLRYSRKENRFVSCDLGETASYSLFLPTSNPDGDISISIPDTVEAHRQNSKRQRQEKDGYQEEIQLLNKVYRKKEEERKGSEGSAGPGGAREATQP
ncbi:probable G-protein coupled receptor 149 [Dipodomys spectabilis]|uniref:probable G-protein coupled receptor 149 n=1 Tax=Dipodomys spectabilis TaxID=105255 RepID=UPI001C5481EF|nr:probable G-protein coupled receptor 149 [Dipodomys spectabilis]